MCPLLPISIIVLITLRLFPSISPSGLRGLRGWIESMSELCLLCLGPGLELGAESKFKKYWHRQQEQEVLGRWNRIDLTLKNPCTIHLPRWSQILFLPFLCSILCYRELTPANNISQEPLPAGFWLDSVTVRHWWEIRGKRREEARVFLSSSLYLGKCPFPKDSDQVSCTVLSAIK